MGNNIRYDFHAANAAGIDSFITVVNGWVKNPLIAKAHSVAPEIVKRGRTMAQIVFDDLLKAYGTVLKGVDDSRIPLSPYKQILSARLGKDVSDRTAKKYLDRTLADARARQDDDIGAPEFLDVLMASPPSIAVNTVIVAWLGVISNYAKLPMSDEDLETADQPTRIAEKFNQKFTLINANLQTSRAIAYIAENQAVDKPAANDSEVKNPAPAASHDDEEDESEEDLAILAAQVDKAKMPEPVRVQAQRELKKLRRMNPHSHDFSVAFSYVETLAEMPWNARSPLKDDLASIRPALDQDHYGLDEVKDAIEEILAVQLRTGRQSGKVICLVGRPGVGKTSIGASIARVTGREFIKLGMGGVAGEPQLRGHSRTYIGAKQGIITEGIRRAKTRNPIIMLDEIDKMGEGGGNQGDPRAALLEVLDPEQNDTFTDHYLDVPFDLSETMFIATANYLGNIPGPLLDRMELIFINNYTRDEKLNIATRYLLPKQMKKHGLDDNSFSLDSAALTGIIESYTREAGVRILDRRIEKICRKAVMRLGKNNGEKIAVTPEDLAGFLGAPPIAARPAIGQPKVGNVAGLAFTEVGGKTLPIQVRVIPSKSFKIIYTGLLGDVMRESIFVAEGLIKDQAAKMGVSRKKLEESEIHIHFPDGATPKDGPSAGLAITTAILSALTDTKVRQDLAMTGEVDLDGNALPIGGVREKLEGALIAGIKTVLIPQGNIGDLEKVPAAIKSYLEIVAVSSIDDVLAHALTEKLQPLGIVRPGLMDDEQFRTLMDQFSVVANSVVNEKKPGGPPEAHIDIAVKILKYFHDHATAPMPSNVVPINPPPSSGPIDNDAPTGTHSAPAP